MLLVRKILATIFFVWQLEIPVLVAPKFTMLPKNPTEAIEGFSIMLDCIAEGDPKPTIQWDKNLKMNDFNHSR